MQQENDKDDIQVGRPDTRRYQGQDNDGHTGGSNLSGNTQESMKKVREDEKNDNSELNQLDDRQQVDVNDVSQ